MDDTSSKYDRSACYYPKIIGMKIDKLVDDLSMPTSPIFHAKMRLTTEPVITIDND